MSIIKKEFSKLIDICIEKNKDIVSEDKYRLKYHLMPPIGWLNDPNGLCYFNDEYHIFYQYSPFEVNGGLKFWGHYKSKDLINWEDLGAKLYPDTPYDCHGAYSGSAFVENNKMYFYYTGNVKHVGDYDYVNDGREHNTIMFTSEDGVEFSDKKLILKNIDYPNNMTCHVRDPKIFKIDNDYYMVLGARDKSDKGCILIYKSKDLYNWTYSNTVSTNEKFGYMWECPDIFELKDLVTNEKKYILNISPQGIEKDGYKYNNIYQSGYFILDMNIKNNKFEFNEFTELDRGFDFYAPQTFVDNKGRTIMIGWMGLPDIEKDYYTNPTDKFNWMHALTIPRELILKNNKLYQQPIEEMKDLRINHINVKLKDEKEYKGLKSNIYELDIKFNNIVDQFRLELKQDLELNFNKEKGIIKLKLGKSGYGRDLRIVELSELRNLQIFMDSSSIEIFINDGAEVFTTRIYSDKNTDNIVMTGNLGDVEINLYELGEYKYV